MFDQFATWLTYSVFGLMPNTRIGEVIHFFVYDLLKIYFLFFLVVALISFFRSFLPPHRIRKILMNQRFGIGHILSAFFGAITPFCSCSSIPFFVGLMEAEVPVGIAFSFLIASPLVNEVVFVLMGGMFGWKIALIYAVSGIALAVFAGILMGRMGLEKEILLKADEKKLKSLLSKTVYKNLQDRIWSALRRAYYVFRNIWWVILIGISIGALIHGYVPEEFFAKVLGNDSWLAVPASVVAGVPIYARSATIVPIIFAMTSKGVQLGTALAFMMATAGLSLPEAIMLKKLMSAKILAIFFSLVAIGIMIIGYLFNIIL